MTEPATPPAGARTESSTSKNPPTPLRKTTGDSASSTPQSPASGRRNSLGQLVRTASQRLMDSNPPSGFASATGQIASKAPTMKELRSSSYSSARSRRTSQPLQSPVITEDERSQSRLSGSDVGSTPFMTPLATPVAVANSEYVFDPEPLDTVESGQKTPKQASPEKTPRRRSLKDVDDPDHYIGQSMAQDEDLAPALTMMSHGELVEHSEESSNRNSAVNKRSSIKSAEPGKRTSFLARLIKGKENSAPDDTEDDTDHTSKPNSQNLGKQFQESTSKQTVKTALSNPTDLSNDPKSRSKDLDTTSQRVTTGEEKRRTRDFADMVEGDDADFPDLLFGRDEMNTQSYDASQKKIRVPKDTISPPDSREPSGQSKDKQSTLMKTTKHMDESATTGISAEPAKKPTRDVPGTTSDEDEDEDEEDIDWDDFMRGIDERPPRRSKRASKDVSKFFGEDPSAEGRELSPAPLFVGTSLDGTNDTPEKPKRFSRPLSTLSFNRTSEPNVDPTPRRSPANLQNHMQRDTEPAKKVQEAHATEEPAVNLAATEAKAEKALAVGAGSDDDEIYPTGYRFPPKKTAWQGFLAGSKAFFKFSITPLGFFVVLYGLLVVAWGGMLFLLLCNAAPAMCRLGDGRFDCNDIDSPRRVWVEIDSQILNAFFCVTGFGLIYWRFRDFYFLMRYRYGHDETALRRLAGWHAGWFRLPDSQTQPVPTHLPPGRTDPAAMETNTAYPLPASRAPLLPLTGSRAPATPLWKMDFVVWAFVGNTAVQACLSGAMWGLNRYNRPSWVTGFLVALACLIAIAGGVMQFVEGRKIKQIEGIPWDDGREMDREMGLDTPTPPVTSTEEKHVAADGKLTKIHRKEEEG